MNNELRKFLNITRVVWTDVQCIIDIINARETKRRLELHML
jgi:hypothetical protein